MGLPNGLATPPLHLAKGHGISMSKRSVHSPVWQDHWDIVPLTTSLSSTEYKEIAVYSGIYPAMKTNETRSFVTAWVELEITTCHTPVREQSIISAASEI